MVNVVGRRGLELRSAEQIEKLTKRAMLYSRVAGAVAICAIIAMLPTAALSSYPPPIIAGLLIITEFILGLLFLNISERMGTLPMLTSGEKLTVLLGRLIDKLKSYTKFSNRDRKRAGRSVQFETMRIDSWVDQIDSYGKQDVMSEEFEAFSKDLKLVMSGLRKCVQRGIDVPNKTVIYLQSIVSQKEDLHLAYHEPCQQCNPEGNHIRAYLKRAIEHLQAVGIDDATPEATMGYRFRIWLGKRTLWFVDLIGLMIWGVLGIVILLGMAFGAFVFPMEGLALVAITYLLGFLMIPPFIHALHTAYLKVQR